MARLQPHPILQNINGSLGELVFRRSAGRLIVCRKPDFSRRVLSPAQQKQVDRFRKATQYAREAMADPAKRAAYEALGARTGKPARSVAIAEYFENNPN